MPNPNFEIVSPKAFIFYVLSLKHENKIRIIINCIAHFLQHEILYVNKVKYQTSKIAKTVPIGGGILPKFQGITIYATVQVRNEIMNLVYIFFLHH